MIEARVVIQDVLDETHAIIRPFEGDNYLSVIGKIQDYLRNVDSTCKITSIAFYQS